MPHPDKSIMTRLQRGFTLIEAVIVITITAIISAVVAVFIQAPVKGYFDAARRAEMTDIADTALRRMSRDLHLALPNSVRVTGGNQAIEFLQTSAGGRYRSSGSTTEDILDFNNPADQSFELLGPSITFATTPVTDHQNQIVIYNLGITGADAYSGNTAATDNRRAYSGAAGATTTVNFTSSNAFPFDSPSHTFYVVDTPVSYICDTTAGTLTRYSGYAILSSQPNPPGVTGSLLAKNVAACSFIYTSGVTERSGLVSLHLTLSQSGETVTLYHEVHVNNVP
jgi:MSHA biogenesis protein MshO